MEFSESSSHIHRAKKVQEEAGHLLEEAWFFGNPLDKTTNKIMSRCFSDPCPSSNSCNPEMLVKKTKNKIPKSGEEVVHHRGLVRTPSLPTSLGMAEFCQEKVKKPSSRPKLARAPSLPPCTMASDQEEDEDDQEREFTMGRLIRQASLNSSQMLPPRQTSNKVMTQSISIPRQQQHSTKKAEIQQITNMEGCKDRRNKNPNQSKGGFKELGLRYEKEDINPRNGSMVNMIPVGRVDQLGEGKLRRKLSKSQSPPPSIPGWVPDKSSAEDMKAQIKFWARAVASNVRQEC